MEKLTFTSSGTGLLAGDVVSLLDLVATPDAGDNVGASFLGVNVDFASLFADGTGSEAYGVYVNLPEAYPGTVYHNNDLTYETPRWAFYAEQGESRFRRTLFESQPDLGKALIHLHQADSDQPFYCAEGHALTNPVPGAPGGTGNINTYQGDSVVVGPQEALAIGPNWTWVGMHKVYVIDETGTLANGEYWVPLYSYNYLLPV